MSLTELVSTLIAKKDQCTTKKDKIRFIKLALNTVRWTLENFTVDFTCEYLQCIQTMNTRNMEEHFDRVVSLLRQFLEKISVEEKG